MSSTTHKVAPRGAALLALVGASLPMNLDPAIHNVAVVGVGNALPMTGAERSLAASYVQVGNTDKFDARLVHEAIGTGTSAYLASDQITMLAMAALIALIALLCLWLLRSRQIACASSFEHSA